MSFCNSPRDSVVVPSISFVTSEKSDFSISWWKAVSCSEFREYPLNEIVARPPNA